MIEILLGLFIIVQFIVSLFFIHIFIIVFIPIKKNKKELNKEKFYSFDIYIPVYKELTLVKEAIETIREQDYPEDKINIVVVADKCDETSLSSDLGKNVTVLFVNFTQSSKINSLKYAFNNTEKKSDYIIILDVDNNLEKNFLKEINSFIFNEEIVVQGQRKPKILNSNISRLDAFTDYFYNFVDRYSAAKWKLSVSLPGSGTALPKSVFEKYIFEINALGGYDKILQNLLMLDGKKILYNDNAILLDQKLRSSEQYAKQRSRWLASYFYSLKNFSLNLLMKFFKTGKIEYIHYFFINSRPPLALLMAISIVFLFSNFFIMAELSLLWFFLILIFFITLILSLKHYKADKTQYLTLFLTPLLIIKQIIAILNIKKFRGTSTPTNHN